MTKNATTINKDALDHAWNWFQYHAEQRMTMIRFYLTIAAAIGAGIGYLATKDQPLLSCLLSGFGAAASICFMRLDNRVSNLVKLGENALKTQQAIMSQKLQKKEFQICHLADDVRRSDKTRRFVYPYTYGENFRFLFSAAVVIFAIIFHNNFEKVAPGYSLRSWVCSPTLEKKQSTSESIP